MTDNNTPPAKIDDARAKPKAAPKAAPKTSKKQKQGGNGLSLFVLLLLIVVTAIGAYGGYWVWQQLGELKAAQSLELRKVNELRAKGAELRGLLDSAAADRSQFQSEIGKLSSSLKKVSEQNQAVAGQLAKIQGTSQTDSMLNELVYFVKLSQRRLALTGDVNGAKSLLIYGDEIAKDIQEQGMIEVRKAIANDLTALSSAAAVDVNGIYLRIDSLAPLISSLSLPPTNFAGADLSEKDPAPKRSLTAGWEGSFKRAIDKIATAISNSFSFQKLDAPVKPLKSPEQRLFLEQNITLALEQAQLGLLRGDKDIYSNSLYQALTWVKDHYRTDNAVGSAVLKRLEELMAITITPDTPSIDESVNAVISFKEVWAENKAKRTLVKASISKAQGEAKVESGVQYKIEKQIEKNIESKAENSELEIKRSAANPKFSGSAVKMPNSDAAFASEQVTIVHSSVPTATSPVSVPKQKTPVELAPIADQAAALIQQIEKTLPEVSTADEAVLTTSSQIVERSLSQTAEGSLSKLTDASLEKANDSISKLAEGSLQAANGSLQNAEGSVSKPAKGSIIEADAAIAEVEQSISEVEDSIRKLKASVKEAEDFAAQVVASSLPSDEEG